MGDTQKELRTYRVSVIRQLTKNKYSSIIRLRMTAKGFTLVEVSIYLSLLVMLLAVVLPILQIFTPQDTTSSSARLDQEARVFFQQFEQEIRQGTIHELDATRLEIEVDDRIYSYHKHGNVIRRQVNGKGHLVFARYVDHIQFFKINDQLLQVQLTLHRNNEVVQVERTIGMRVDNHVQSVEK